MTSKTVHRSQPALVNAVDPLGRPIEPYVLSVAQDIAPQAVSYAQKSLADSCVAVNLLEEAAATVSEAVLAKQLAELPPVRNMRSYLYRAFLRRLFASRQAEIRLEEAFEERLRLNEGMSFDEKLEARLLLKQILCMCDRKTMWIVWERIEGRSWDEIAHDCVMTNRAARLQAESPVPCDDCPLTVREAARYLGVSPQTVYLWVERKQIPHLRVMGRNIRFLKSELETFRGTFKQEMENG
jgi:excisionase family DNA binding protein